MGFKFCSAIGELVAKQVVEEIDDRSSELLKYFAIDREGLEISKYFEYILSPSRSSQSLFQNPGSDL